MALRFHPDGYWIFPDGQHLALADFLRFEPDFALPVDMIGLEYRPGVSLIYFDSSTSYPQQGVTVWAEGDSYIERQPLYFGSVKRNHQSPRVKQLARIAAKADAKRARLKDIPKPVITDMIGTEDNIASIIKALVDLGLVEDKSE